MCLHGNWPATDGMSPSITIAPRMEPTPSATRSEPSLKERLPSAQIFLVQALANQEPKPAQALIVNVLDQQITAPSPEYFSYSVARIGLEGATRLAVFDLAPSIRDNH